MIFSPYVGLPTKPNYVGNPYQTRFPWEITATPQQKHCNPKTKTKTNLATPASCALHSRHATQCELSRQLTVS